MSNHNLNGRLANLEKQTGGPGRVVTVYADQTTPAQLQALRTDPTIETLIIVEYAEGVALDEPGTE